MISSLTADCFRLSMDCAWKSIWWYFYGFGSIASKPQHYFNSVEISGEKIVWMFIMFWCGLVSLKVDVVNSILINQDK